MSQTYSDLQVNTDGGSRGNPGKSAIGVYATSGGQIVFTVSKYIGITTNNVAEYTAVLEALLYLSKNDLVIDNLNFVLDSELIVKQIIGVYKVKQEHLALLKNQIQELLSNLKKDNKVKNVNFSNVLREKNKEADKLVNLALDSQ